MKMRKALFIMAAALMTMTQCKKQEMSPAAPAADTIKMTVTAGSGAKTDINTETGAITWSEGDKLYVSDGTSWLGSLTLVSGAGTPQGTFTGSVTGLDDEGAPCHFFYLGKGNIATTPTGTAAVSISLASQDGTLRGENGAMKYHAGYGRTDVTVTEGEATGYVLMNTKIAIAHINFTKDSQPYTGLVTMGGTGVSNTLTVSPDGSFSGGDDGGIAIDKGDGTTGERFVTLIPTGTTDVLNVAFTGDATGGMTFANGIEANKFYGMKDAIAVTLEAAAAPSYLPGDFSVSANTKVKFSKGNLYYDGSAFHFETNQLSFANAWNASHVSHFFWSKSAPVAYAGSYSASGTSTSDVFFTNATQTTASSSFQVDGEEACTWRTLSSNEWVYLMTTRTASTINETSNARFAEVKVNGVCGMMLFPDTFTWPEGVTTNQPSTFNTKSSTWNDVDYSTTDFGKLESAGVVFLPAAGYRVGTAMKEVGSKGCYWSSTPNGTGQAYYLDFILPNANPSSFMNRLAGSSVRLVR